MTREEQLHEELVEIGKETSKLIAIGSKNLTVDNYRKFKNLEERIRNLIEKCERANLGLLKGLAEIEKDTLKDLKK